MNYLKWDDFNPKDYDEMYEMFKPSFYRLLPNNSKGSFEYHSRKYNFLMVTDFDLKNTFVEELERFESYLIETYDLKTEN
jgi:hypothetical protein